MHVSFNPLAERELNEAAAYYERAQVGLGADFLSEVERVVLASAESPEAGLVLTGRVRRRLCRRFPYAILYRAAPDELRVLAVMNLNRRPSYWHGRT